MSLCLIDLQTYLKLIILKCEKNKKKTETKSGCDEHVLSDTLTTDKYGTCRLKSLKIKFLVVKWFQNVTITSSQTDQCGGGGGGGRKGLKSSKITKYNTKLSFSRHMLFFFFNFINDYVQISIIINKINDSL